MKPLVSQPLSSNCSYDHQAGKWGGGSFRTAGAISNWHSTQDQGQSLQDAIPAHILRELSEEQSQSHAIEIQGTWLE